MLLAELGSVLIHITLVAAVTLIAPLMGLGWAIVQAQEWQAPLYWRRTEAGWRVFTLHGEQPMDPAEPVVHVS